jgi:hypothetical protein
VWAEPEPCRHRRQKHAHGERQVGEHVAAKSRRGSLIRRYSHSRPSRCIHWGARGRPPAANGIAAPRPTNHAVGRPGGRAAVARSCRSGTPGFPPSRWIDCPFSAAAAVSLKITEESITSSGSG